MISCQRGGFKGQISIRKKIDDFAIFLFSCYWHMWPKDSGEEFLKQDENRVWDEK